MKKRTHRKASKQAGAALLSSAITFNKLADLPFFFAVFVYKNISLERVAKFAYNRASLCTGMSQRNIALDYADQKVPCNGNAVMLLQNGG